MAIDLEWSWIAGEMGLLLIARRVGRSRDSAYRKRREVVARFSSASLVGMRASCNLIQSGAVPAAWWISILSTVRAGLGS